MMQFDVGGIIWGLPLKIENVILEISNYWGFGISMLENGEDSLPFILILFCFFLSSPWSCHVDIVDFICL
jgi:hypothetical protein